MKTVEQRAKAEEKRSAEANANGLVTEACVMTGQVDWQLLRMQKDDLVNIIKDRTQTCATLNQERENNSLQGILHLIDHIQDDAATTLTENIVFCEYPQEQ